ncbi:MAG: helix-hairpin-helix domain-containing protein [Dehalococcoidia bacterium]|nr:helix-hairpin-helix domain-containing protein [Dehalococcoidia bacterium]
MSPESQRPLPTVRLRPATVLNVLLLALALVAFVLLATREPSSPGIEVIRADPPPGVDAIHVHVTGAVADPGVVVAQPGHRVADVIALAGGANNQADLSAVNLALRVRDEDAVHVPARGESVALSLVDVNSATQAELESLPGIGPVRAAAIIAARPYLTSEELLDRAVIPAGVYEQIRGLVTAR